MEGDVVNHVGDMSAGFPAGEDISVTSIRAMGRTTWDEHVRINLFTEIIKFLPNLSTADLDVMSDQVISVKLLHALLQKPIIDLSVNGPEGERIQPIMLATMIHALPGLVRLAIDGADEALDCFSDEEHLPYVISHLEHLETLFLSDAHFVDKTFADQDWKGKLSVLGKEFSSSVSHGAFTERLASQLWMNATFYLFPISFRLSTNSVTHSRLVV
jgi:hypothetical protein